MQVNIIIILTRYTKSSEFFVPVIKAGTAETAGTTGTFEYLVIIVSYVE